ncbi:hypothetical protein K5I29_02530 [Flavobacterium agricola]|uniref:Uncharacterized protein n=1 Tax=Flavobacterium agricola TaxID=2870839 RepID=A0ABY6M0P3_9FLAO|nr:hypothetical protein [Flavobacterium agricola]UYW01817.1 hypothetical protein K5I29_02530 [Flavobacterium agricola]
MKYSIESFYDFIKQYFCDLGFDDGQPFPYNGCIDFYMNNKKYETSYLCSNDRMNDNKFLVGTSLYNRISFQEVNDILFKFIANDNNEHYTVHSLPDYDLYEEELLALKHKYIESEKDLEEVKNILLPYISQRVLPFFEQIKTVEDVNEKIINVVDWMRWADYIPGQTYYKALIILKLSKSSSYDSFYLMYKDRLEGYLSGEMPELASYLKTFISIKEYLDQNY